MSRINLFWSDYLSTLDTWQATRAAIAQVSSNQNPLLTTNEIAPHLAHRHQLRLAITDPPIADLSQYDNILLNVRHAGWQSDRQFANDLVVQLKALPSFALHYAKDDIYLFTKT